MDLAFLFDYKFVYNYSVLDWMCIVTAIVSVGPTLHGAIKAWWTGELGAGARRPEPNVAALLANVSWFLFGCTEGQLEPFGLNAVGGIVQMVAIAVFLRLCAPDQRGEALILPMAYAVMQLGMTIPVGFTHIDTVVYQCLCSFAGVVAAAAPLLTYLCLLDDPTAEQLPPHWELLGYTVHGTIWCVRAWTKDPRNYYMLSQNAMVVFSSVLLLYILTTLPMIEEEPETSHNRSIIGGIMHAMLAKR